MSKFTIYGGTGDSWEEFKSCALKGPDFFEGIPVIQIRMGIGIICSSRDFHHRITRMERMGFFFVHPVRSTFQILSGLKCDGVRPEDEISVKEKWNSSGCLKTRSRKMKYLNKVSLF